MAELPKYQQTGRVFADLPQFDFSNVRESFQQSQRLAGSLDRLSSFAGRVAEKAVEEEAEKWAVANGYSYEQILEAQKQGITADELIASSGGGVIWQNTIRKIQGEQLRVEIEGLSRQELAKVQAAVETRELTDPDEIAMKIDSIGKGLFAPLQSISPDAYVKGRNAYGLHAASVYNESKKQIVADIKAEAAVKADGNYASIMQLNKAAIPNLNDGESVNAARDLTAQRVYEAYAAKGNTAEGRQMAEKARAEFDNQLSNYFESIALSKDYVTQTASGLPDINATMQKMSNGDFGDKTLVWESVDQDKKDKILQSVYSRLTQSYSANKTMLAAEKEQKELDNMNTLLNLRTPGKVTGQLRFNTVRKLAEDGVITPAQYSELLEDKPRELTANQKYLKDFAAYEIRMGLIKSLPELQEKYGSKLPMTAIGDLLSPLVSEDEKAYDKFKSKYSGADYDPYHLQPTTQQKWIDLTNETDKLLAETNTDGTRKFTSKLAAAKAATEVIEQSKATIANVNAQKSLYNSLKAFKIDPDAGGAAVVINTMVTNASSKKEKERAETLQDDYQKYLEYKRKNGNKSYKQLPDEATLQSGSK
jgi:hypothetical protein